LCETVFSSAVCWALYSVIRRSSTRMGQCVRAAAVRGLARATAWRVLGRGAAGGCRATRPGSPGRGGACCVLNLDMANLRQQPCRPGGAQRMGWNPSVIASADSDARAMRGQVFQQGVRPRARHAYPGFAGIA
jgi:hypothetical protein